MTKYVLLICIFLMVCPIVRAGETIIGQGEDSYLYSDGKMKQGEPQFEITYYLEGDTITRLRVFDLKRREVIPDNTIYRIQRQLDSDPTKGTSSYSIASEGSVIRAIGQPGTDAIEILMISETFIQSVRSTADYFIITRYKRIK